MKMKLTNALMISLLFTACAAAQAPRNDKATAPPQKSWSIYCSALWDGKSEGPSQKRLHHHQG
jgi:hypothetical protein